MQNSINPEVQAQIDNLVALFPAPPTTGIKNGDRVTVTFKGVSAGGTAVGGVANGGNFMVRLDGTDQMVAVPDTFVSKEAS